MRLNLLLAGGVDPYALTESCRRAETSGPSAGDLWRAMLVPVIDYIFELNRDDLVIATEDDATAVHLTDEAERPLFTVERSIIDPYRSRSPAGTPSSTSPGYTRGALWVPRTTSPSMSLIRGPSRGRTRSAWSSAATSTN